MDRISIKSSQFLNTRFYACRLISRSRGKRREISETERQYREGKEVCRGVSRMVLEICIDANLSVAVLVSHPRHTSWFQKLQTGSKIQKL